MKTKLLIFGITGDLSTRKLLPALMQIVATGDYEPVSIIGVSRREVNVAELLHAHPSLIDRTMIFSMDLAAKADYGRLREFVQLQDDEQLLVYLSVPPTAATQIVDFMGEAGMNTSNVKLMFEKPFGVDLASAQDMIARTGRYYDEAQIYRIDHYLAKEMAQNIVAFRGGNALFSHIWSNAFIDSIEIVASEKIGIEGRAQFYEQTGALRDLVQGHLLQLLALTLMDIPHNFNWNELPALRKKALDFIEVVRPKDVIRAQYEGYQQEVENVGSQTETFVSLNLSSAQPQWKGVDIKLVTGKALAEKATEVRIHLKKDHEAQSNTIIFRIQPNEGVAIELRVKNPGYDQTLDTRNLGFSFPADETLPDAYEHVLVEAIRGTKSLFTSSDEVERSWTLLADVQRVWAMDNAPLRQYTPGTAWSDVS